MEQQIHKATDDARAGSTPHIGRYVLGASLLLVLAAMIIVYLWGDANTHDDAGDSSTVATAEQAQP